MTTNAGGHFIGYVAGPPELRQTSTGTDVLNFTLEIRSRSFDRRMNAWKDAAPVRVRCNAFDQMGRNAHLSIQEGDRVIVLGKFRDNHGLELDVDAMGLDLREHSFSIDPDGD